MASFDREDLQRDLRTANSLNEIAYRETTEVENADDSATDDCARISYLCGWVHKNQKKVYKFCVANYPLMFLPLF